MRRLSPVATYKGRISRSTYWKYMLPYMAVFFVAGLVDAMAGFPGGIGPLTVIGALIFAVPAWRLAMRRCHDRGHSAIYMVLLYMIPVLGGWWLFLELGFFKGTTGSNRFGMDPTRSTA